MLQDHTVAPETIELIKDIQKIPELQQFVLVGGTALALQIGHRISIDIDLFSTEPFDAHVINDILREEFGFRNYIMRGSSLIGEAKGIKIDCILQKGHYIEPSQEIDGIRMIGLKDICAKKFLAILQNGTRVKDFIDVSFLSHHFSLNEMLKFFQYHFPEANYIDFVKALTYFDDVDLNVPINMVNNSFSWTKIKKRIIDMVNKPDIIFNNYPL